MQAQFPAKLEFLFRPARYKVAYGGRGGSKSWAFARALLILGAQKPLRVLCAREIQNSIADSVHKLLSDQIAALGLGDFYAITDTAIVGRNGTEFAFAGLRQQSVGKIKSFEGVDVAWVEEAQAVSERSWSILTPTIRKPGSEIWVTFNPELDTDPTYVRFVRRPPPGAVVVKVNWNDNPWFPDVLERERRHCLETDPEGYRNIWEGECRSAVQGAVYASELDKVIQTGRLRTVPVDPLLKVHTVWDLGHADNMAVILAQRAASEMRVVGYLQDKRRPVADYVADLKALGYHWGYDFIPHDGFAKTHQFGMSTEDVLKALGRKVKAVPNETVAQGIQAARMLFPRCYFDEGATGPLIDCLKRYRFAQRTDGSEGGPVHDDASHGADAFRYLALVEPMMTNDDETIGDFYGAFRRAG